MLRRAGAGADLRAANVTVAESLLVASLAGMGNVLLTNPIWMVRGRAARGGGAAHTAAVWLHAGGVA